MCAPHPVVAPLSLVIAIAYAAVVKGPRPALSSLGFAALIIAVVTIFNAIFVHQGFTLVGYLFKNPVTLEAIQYGFTLGTMLAAVLTWFTCYNAVVGSDRFLAIFSSIAPVSAMMVSMIFNFIPQILQKSSAISDAHRAFAYVDKTSSTKPETDILTVDAGRFGRVEAIAEPASASRLSRLNPKAITEQLRWPVKLATILMSWSMETSLATAASMRARAYGAAKRSSYLPLSWTLRDRVLLVLMSALFVAAVLAEYSILQGFAFYPRMAALTATAAYLPLAALMAFPLVYEGGIRLRWRLSKF